MNGLMEFLADRYDEAATRAHAAMRAGQAASAQWTAGSSGDGRDEVWRVADGDNCLVVYHVRAQAADASEEAIAAYIADVDPAHRLADIALKRAILAEHASDCCVKEMVCGEVESWYSASRDDPCATVRQLGTEFADHPAYRSEWAP